MSVRQWFSQIRNFILSICFLKTFCSKVDWDEWIRCGIFSYNTSVHDSTGFTPHELVFGVKALIPTEFAREAVPKTFIQYLDDLFKKITSSQATAAENLEQAKERSKLYCYVFDSA